MITKEQIESLDGRLSYLKECLGIDGKRIQVEELQKKTESPDFWNDPKSAESFLKDLNATKSWVTDYYKAATAMPKRVLKRLLTRRLKRRRPGNSTPATPMP